MKHYQGLSEDLSSRVSRQDEQLHSLGNEKSRLLREISQLRASAVASSSSTPHVTLSSATGVAHLKVAQAGTAVAAVLSPSEAALRSVGSLKGYELAAAVVFVLFMANWYWL